VLRILVTLVGRRVLRVRVTFEVSIAHACNVEAAYYLLCIYVLINCALRNVSYIA